MAAEPKRAPDTARRSKAQRSGRQRGCSVYIDAEQLVAAGINPADDVPFYTVRGYQRSRNGRSVIVSLYREP